MDISQLTRTAQAIVAELELAAQSSVQSRGYGYAQINEDRIGGLGENPPVSSDFSDDADFAAATEAWVPHPNRVAVHELRDAGVDIRVSQGGSMRMISLHGVRLTAKRPAA
jgi:hypothetical protein